MEQHLMRLVRKYYFIGGAMGYVFGWVSAWWVFR